MLQQFCVIRQKKNFCEVKIDSQDKSSALQN